MINTANHVWTVDTRTNLRTRLARAFGAVWTADDREVIYAADQALWSRPASGEGAPTQIVAFKERSLGPLDASPSGKDIVVLASGNDEAPSDDLWLVDLTDGRTRPVVASDHDERQASFSPDGRWLAYAANPTGAQEIYVRLVDGSGAAVRVSTAGGQHPFWRRDGKELFFLSPTDEVVAVDVTMLARGGPPGRPVVLFRVLAADEAVRRRVPPYAVAADGQRFLVNVPTVPATLTLIQLPQR